MISALLSKIVAFYIQIIIKRLRVFELERLIDVVFGVCQIVWNLLNIDFKKLSQQYISSNWLTSKKNLWLKDARLEAKGLKIGFSQ